MEDKMKAWRFRLSPSLGCLSSHFLLRSVAPHGRQYPILQV
jgi:hypothetical protein